MTLLDWCLLAASSLILLPLGLFTLECLLALWPRGATAPHDEQAAPSVAVVIPAHNEELVIERTLRTLLPTLGPGDRVVVVADNCTDHTAALARAAGASVLERHHATERGKGYALDFGVRSLAESPPEIVVILDADCDVGPTTIRTLAAAAHEAQRPAQALYLWDNPPDGPPWQAVSALGLRIRNGVRPAGLLTLGLPCHLMGSGMAFPWRLLREAPLASGHLVEDMQLGLHLAEQGHTTLFVPAAVVTSQPPDSDAAFASQRTRWEHGHLNMAFSVAPRLLVSAVRQMRLDLAALALDLVVPPFSLLWGAWFAATLCAWIAWACGASMLPAALLSGAGGLALAAIAAAWYAYCREAIPLGTVLSIPWYLLRKIPIYAGYLVAREDRWVRTERSAT